MKILVVDDEFSSLSHFLNKIIGKWDADYRFYKDDEEVILSYVKNNHVDGAFLDIYMPHINGVELAKKLVAINSDIKIVFITGGNLGFDDVDESIKDNVLGFIYKPIDEIKLSNYLLEMENKRREMTIKTFGSFDCFMNGNIVRFSSSKSKELFALLIAFNGKSLTMSQAITYLWPDKDIDRAKILYRDAVWRLRQTLNEINFKCVEFLRALLILDKHNIKCDYYDFLEGDVSLYNNEFLTSYDWSIEFESSLNEIKNKRGGSH